MGTGLRAMAVAALFTMTACGGCEPDTDSVEAGQILVTPDPVTFSRVAVGEAETRTVLVSNESPTGDLQIFSLEFVDSNGAPRDGLSLVDPPDVSQENPLVIPTRENIELTIQFEPTGPLANEAFLRITSSAARPALRDYDLLGSTLPNPPELGALPPLRSVSRLPAGASPVHKVAIRDPGSAAM